MNRSKKVIPRIDDGAEWLICGVRRLVATFGKQLVAVELLNPAFQRSLGGGLAVRSNAPRSVDRCFAFRAWSCLLHFVPLHSSCSYERRVFQTLRFQDALKH